MFQAARNTGESLGDVCKLERVGSQCIALALRPLPASLFDKWTVEGRVNA
jgi:hypothetical protein